MTRFIGNNDTDRTEISFLPSALIVVIKAIVSHVILYVCVIIKKELGFLHGVARDTLGIIIKTDDVSGKKKKFDRFYIYY